MIIHMEHDGLLKSFTWFPNTSNEDHDQKAFILSLLVQKKWV